MADFKITIKAVWDDEAKVWIATSEDIPGLVAEAASADELQSELMTLVPELLKLNHLIDPDHHQVPVHLLQEREFTVTA